MLNRKSNDAPACAGIGAAQRASPRINPEINNDRCFILTSLHEPTRFVNSKRDATPRALQARLGKSMSINQLALPARGPGRLRARRIDWKCHLAGTDDRSGQAPGAPSSPDLAGSAGRLRRLGDRLAGRGAVRLTVWAPRPRLPGTRHLRPLRNPRR